MTALYIIVVFASVLLGLAFLVVYPGRASRQSPEPNSGLLLAGAAVLAATSGLIHHSDRHRPITFVTPGVLLLFLVACFIVMQFRDRRAQRAAGGTPSFTDTEPTEGGGPR